MLSAARVARCRPPGGPPGAKKFAIHARIYDRKPSSIKVSLNASRTSKKRVSACLGMPWRRNEQFYFFVIVYYVLSYVLRITWRGAPQNKNRPRRWIAKQKIQKRQRQNVNKMLSLFCWAYLRRIQKRAWTKITANTEYRKGPLIVYRRQQIEKGAQKEWKPTANSKRCLFFSD